MRYRTEIIATKDGKGMTGMATYLDGNVWRVVGETRTYWTYPAAVRARSAAEALARAHARKHYPLHTFTAEKV